MTVGELKNAIELLDDDSEVRVAIQPRWAFEYSIDKVIVIDDDKSDVQTVYLSEGSQIGYLPGNVAEELGWR